MSTGTTIEMVAGEALVTTGAHRLRVVPRERAGADAGCPVHMLEAALGACIALTLDAVAKNKGIDISNLKVRLERQHCGKEGTRFTVEIDLGPGLTDREQKILCRSAQLCEICSILKGNTQIDYRLREPTEPADGKIKVRTSMRARSPQLDTGRLQSVSMALIDRTNEP